MYLLQLNINKYNLTEEIEVTPIKIKNETNDFYEVEASWLAEPFIYKNNKQDNYMLNKGVCRKNNEGTLIFQMYVLDKSIGELLIIQEALNYLRNEELVIADTKNLLLKNYGKQNTKNYNAAMKEAVTKVHQELYNKDMNGIDDFLSILKNMPKEILQLAKTFSWENEYVLSLIKKYLKERG